MTKTSVAKRSCPNCAEAYMEGYQEAWKQFEKQLLEIQECRPVRIIVPENSHIITDTIVDGR